MKNGIVLFAIALFSFSAWSNPADKIATGFLKVVPGQLYGFSKYPSELKTLKASFPVIEAVLNSNEFKDKVINYVGLDGKRAFTSNKGMTNEQIYEYLMQGKEVLNGNNTLGEMNFNVERYYKWWSKVIGYTEPTKHSWIEVNGKFYQNYAVNEVAGNISHEWIHLTGFTHDSARDHDSVPYALGYIVEDLAKKFMKQGFLD